MREIMHMFLDTVDAAKSQTPTAFLQCTVDEKCTLDEDEISKFSRAASRQLMRDDLHCIDLEVVDPMESQYVWAIVDEGCNSCCHGEYWLENAREEWRKNWL